MDQSRSKTRELLDKLATTEFRRSLRADQIFRQLRDAAREPMTPERPNPADTQR